MLFKIDFEKAYDKVRWDFVQEAMEGKGPPVDSLNHAHSRGGGGESGVH
jgi:hypothetical protein